MPLDPRATRRAQRLSVAEGVLWAVMVGCGETWFVADAVRLGAAPTIVALVVTLPLFLGSLGPLWTVRSLPRLRSRRRWVVTAAAIQGLLLAALAVLAATGREGPLFLIATASLYQVLGQAAGAAWGSWFADVVPRPARGQWFGRRNRWVHLATSLSILAAGAGLDRLELAGPGRGFAVVYGIGAAVRLVSALLLALTPEPAAAAVPRARRVRAFLATDRGSAARRIVTLGAALHFAVYLGAPYFTPYMLEEIRLDYLEYTLATLTMVLFKVVTMPRWGRAIDDHGARPAFALAVVLIGLLPLAWVGARSLWIVLAAQALSGLSWAGHELASFTLLLDSSYRGTRMHVFAAQSLGNGIAQLTGSLVGALLLGPVGGYAGIFAVSAGARLAVAACVPRMLPSVQPTLGRRQMALRVLGLRPSGALVHRPVPMPDDEPREEGREP